MTSRGGRDANFETEIERFSRSVKAFANCPACGGALRVEELPVPQRGMATLGVEGRCLNCGRCVATFFTKSTLGYRRFRSVCGGAAA